MIIKDNWKDFYDYAGLGRDDSITLDRDSQTYVTFEGDHGIPATSRYHGHFGDRVDIQYRPGFVVLGGMGFAVVAREESIYYEDPRITGYFFDAEVFLEHLATGPRTARWREDRYQRRRITPIIDHLKLGNRDLGDLAIEKRMISGTLLRERETKIFFNDRPGMMTFTPTSVKETGLQDILPGHEAHQLVSRFVGGILTEPQVLPELSDKSKIAKAGFDQQSFRKRKPS